MAGDPVAVRVGAYGNKDGQTGTAGMGEVAADAAPTGMAVVLACYGSARAGGLEAAYGGLVREVAAAAPGVRVGLAVVSAPVRRELEAQGEKAAGLGDVLRGLAAEGVRSVVVQPVLVGEGRTLDAVRAEAAEARDAFERLVVGDPLVASADDEARLVAAVTAAYPVAPDEALLLVAHGSATGVGARVTGYRGCCHAGGSVTAAPTPRDTSSDPVVTLHEGAQVAVARLRAQAPGATRVTVVPLMLVAGAHVRRELAGDAPDSWRSALVRSGYAVRVCEEGLLALPAVRGILVDHVLGALQTGGTYHAQAEQA